MTDVVRVKEKFQVTLPVGARRLSHIQEGDYLEVTVTDEGGFLLRPKRVVDAVNRRESMLEFLRRNRPAVARPREAIDQALNADRNSWEK